MTISVLAEGAEAASPLLAVNLSAPTVRAPVIRRPRLLAQISHGTQSPLTVVTGPAGAGRSVLVASCAAPTVPRPGRWPGSVSGLVLSCSLAAPAARAIRVAASGVQ